MECAADGNPTPMIKWTLRDVNNNLRVVQHSDNHYGYNITNAGRKDKGTYTCEAKVTGGSFIKQTSYSVIVAVKCKYKVDKLSMYMYIHCRNSLSHGKPSHFHM